MAIVFGKWSRKSDEIPVKLANQMLVDFSCVTFLSVAPPLMPTLNLATSM